jgi:DNA adenine methylase
VPTSYTPLRYPGGKAKLGPYLSEVLRENRLVDATYSEPYAGGAGAGLFLLFRGYASRLRLNDLDCGVVAFWRAVLRRNEEFAKRVERATLTVAEWDRQKSVFAAGGSGDDYGFAFFYLNRTNRSGIMNGGIIGGRDQSGPWGIDARFNRSELASRIRAIGTMKRYITVTRWDAMEFVDDLRANPTKNAFTYFDPPYYHKGQELYTNFYDAADHAVIAKNLVGFRRPWLMTYDDCPEVRKLYKGYTTLSSELSYSARDVRRGREVVIFGKQLKCPAARESSPTKGCTAFSIV